MSAAAERVPVRQRILEVAEERRDPLAVALEVEETELEDKVGDLLKALQQHDEYERCMRLLVHDLGELSYMIEQYCQDPALLQRCDELVNHHAETLRLSAAH